MEGFLDSKSRCGFRRASLTGPEHDAQGDCHPACPGQEKKTDVECAHGHPLDVELIDVPEFVQLIEDK